MMEKLIELLNEYEKELNTGLHWRIDEEYGMLWRGISLTGVEQYLISKHYGFIKRLVENDKIDFENQAMQYAKSDLSKFFAEWKDKNGMSDDYAMLLMLLSISDTPVDDLVSYLK